MKDLLFVHKEADYYLRALIYNKEKSMIADVVHQRLVTIYTCHWIPVNIEEMSPNGIKNLNEMTTQKMLGFTQHRCYIKWKDTWKEQPTCLVGLMDGLKIS